MELEIYLPGVDDICIFVELRFNGVVHLFLSINEPHWVVDQVQIYVIKLKIRKRSLQIFFY